MSATFLGRSGLFSPDRGNTGNVGSNGIADQSVGVIENLETVLMSARQMELGLVQERKRVRALQEELNNVQATYERLLKDARSKGDEISNREIQLKSSLSKFQDNDRILREKLTTLSAGYRKATAELQHYKNTWAGVLQREREARMIIQDSQRTINRATELEQQNKGLGEALDNERRQREQFERHAKSYQQELQNALVRLHSSESKFAELSKEFSAVQQAKKSLDQEVTRIEKTIRERFEWESIREREKMKVELEKESAILLDRQRMELEQRFQAELQMKIEGERSRHQLIEGGLENEIRRLRLTSDQAQSKIDEAKREAAAKVEEAGRDGARLEAQIGELNGKISEFRQQAGSLRGELDQLAVAQGEAESLRNQLSAEQKKSTELAAQVEAERNRAEAESGRAKAETVRADAEAGRAGREAARVAEFEKALLDRALSKLAASNIAVSTETTQKLESKLAITQFETEKRIIELERRAADQIVAERRRASEKISRMKRIRKGGNEAEMLQHALDAEHSRSESLESALISEKERFDRLTTLLSAEVERLRSVYPLQDLLKLKDEEISRVQQQLPRLAEGSVLRGKADASLKLHQEQRTRLKQLIEAAEARLAAHEKRIEQAQNENTVLAEPDNSANFALC